jgi:hypothetical protein
LFKKENTLIFDYVVVGRREEGGLRWEMGEKIQIEKERISNPKYQNLNKLA